MSDFEQILFARDAAIASIELNRPDAANGLTAQMAAELREAARRCDDDPRLKVVVLRARGRFFCAGGDIKEMQSHGDALGRELKAMADDLHGTIATLVRMEPVLIVAVNGVAAGGGFGFAMIGDIVLAAESASFTMAYTKAGLCPDGSSTWLLPRLVGLRKAQELMLLNPKLSAVEALEIGLVTRVVADDALDPEADALAAELARGPRRSHSSIRKLLLASFDHNLEAQMELEGRALAACAASPDGREGIAAFVDKRQPEFE